MDPPYSHHAFSRLQSQQPTPESRYGPIPPSPFASQPAAQRSETLHKNDPFLRRRNDLDERRRSPSMTNEHQSYMLPHASRYTSCSTSVPHDGTTAGTRPRQNSFGAGGLWGDGSGDRLALHRTEGTQSFISLLKGRLEGHVILGTYCSLYPFLLGLLSGGARARFCSEAPTTPGSLNQGRSLFLPFAFSVRRFLGLRFLFCRSRLRFGRG